MVIEVLRKLLFPKTTKIFYRKHQSRMKGRVINVVTVVTVLPSLKAQVEKAIKSGLVY